MCDCFPLPASRFPFPVSRRPSPAAASYMHLQYVVLCDQVIIANDGKPSLIGILNDLQTTAIPANVPRLAFASRILFTGDETGMDHRVEVAIADPSGKEIGRPGGDISLPQLANGIDSIAVDLPLQFDMLELTSAGRYTFLLHIDGKPLGAAQLNVRQVNAV
jgi:hypothetical protein